MAELSSLLFVDTDELGRPTGLIASEENDTFASALMPQDVKDTVAIVDDANVSGNYEGWNTVSGVSGLAPVSAELLALPNDFSSLEASVAYVSTVVDSIDPTAINDVSSTVLNFSGNWQDTYSTVNSTSSIYSGADSGLSSLAASTADISAVVNSLEPANVEAITQILTDGSSVLSSLSGTMGGVRGGPDVSIASALSAVAERIRIIDGKGGTDGGTANTIQLSGTARIQAQGTMTINKVDADGGEIALLKLQGTGPGTAGEGIAYLSANTVGLVGYDDIRIGQTGGLALGGTSSLYGLYKDTQDTSGKWDGAYNYLSDGDTPVSASVDYFLGNSGTLALKNTVDTDDIDNDAITNAKIGVNAVDTLEINDLAITDVKIDDGAVTTAKIATGAVDTNQIAPSSITNSKIDDDQITGRTILDGAVGTLQLAIGAVDTDRIASEAVTAAKIQLSGITGNRIANGAIDTAQLEANAVTSAILATDSVTSDKIEDEAVTSNKIQQGAVGTSQIGENQVTGDKLAEDSVDASNISPNTITTEKLATDSVDTSNIVDAAIITAKLDACSVTVEKLQDVSADGYPSFVSGSFTNTDLTVDGKGRIVAASNGTGGGGGGAGDASAILVGPVGQGTYAPIGGAAPDNNNILIYKSGLQEFRYELKPFVQAGAAAQFDPPNEGITYNFGASAGTKVEFATASGAFTTSGPTKTLLEFDGLSRVGLGLNSVPLEISALGESNVRLRSDNTNGAFVLVEGTDAAPSLVHLKNTDLSADADSQIDFDTDINLGSTAHLNGNTLGSIHIACKNTQGTSVSGGTPVYITGNVGGSNKIQIGVASASVASSMPAVGILSEDLADNIEGYVDAFGIASKLDTSLFTSGDTLYVAPSGGLTNVRPTATTDLVQNIGIVELSDASNGKIIVLGPGRTNDVPTSVNNEVTFASAITVNNTLTANGGTGSSHPTAGGQVLQSRGASTSVTWGNKKKLRWYESDFHSADVRINGPWLGAATNSGTTGGGPAAALYAEMMGAVLLRSSTTANSGYRWDTQAFDRIAPRKNLFFECIFAIPDDFTNKTAKLGFYDDATNTTAGVDGTYFLIDNSGNMTPETSNNSTRTTGTSYSLSVDTVYKAQIWWNGSSSVVFKITNMDESTVHASEVINTNVPSGTARRFGAGLVTESSGTATDDLLVLDYMGWGLYPYREDDSL